MMDVRSTEFQKVLLRPKQYPTAKKSTLSRNVSNPMDKGACNFVNSNMAIEYYNTRRRMLEYVTLPEPLKQSCGNKAKRYGERIVAEAKQESLLLYTGDVKINPVDY